MVVAYNLMVGTISEFAEFIVDKEYEYSGEIPSYDFSVVEKTDIKKQPKEIYKKCCFWYGIKKVCTDFDSFDTNLVSDYYGGGCTNFCTLFYDIDALETPPLVKQMLLKTINAKEMATEDTMLIIERRGED